MSSKDALLNDLVVVPKQYARDSKSKMLTFKHLYIEYSRFHSDETNTIIHLIFIPTIIATLMGIV